MFGAETFLRLASRPCLLSLSGPTEALGPPEDTPHRWLVLASVAMSRTKLQCVAEKKGWHSCSGSFRPKWPQSGLGKCLNCRCARNMGSRGVPVTNSKARMITRKCIQVAGWPLGSTEAQHAQQVSKQGSFLLVLHRHRFRPVRGGFPGAPRSLCGDVWRRWAAAQEEGPTSRESESPEGHGFWG